jgi:hypothetical protein
MVRVPFTPRCEEWNASSCGKTLVLSQQLTHKASLGCQMPFLSKEVFGAIMQPMAISMKSRLARCWMGGALLLLGMLTLPAIAQKTPPVSDGLSVFESKVRPTLLAVVFLVMAQISNSGSCDLIRRFRRNRRVK